MRILLLLLLLCAPAWAEPTHPCWATLEAQRDAWNRGDIDAFLQGYLTTEDVTYTSSGNLVTGYEAIKERYVRRYGTDKQSMGQLAFRPVRFDELGEDHVLVVGEWQLERAGQPDVGGLFSLVMRRTDQGWKCLHDHTSAKESK